MKLSRASNFSISILVQNLHTTNHLTKSCPPISFPSHSTPSLPFCLTASEGWNFCSRRFTNFSRGSNAREMIEFITFNNSNFKTLFTSHPTCHILVVKAVYQQIQLTLIEQQLFKHKTGNTVRMGDNSKASEIMRVLITNVCTTTQRVIVDYLVYFLRSASFTFVQTKITTILHAHRGM